MAKAKQQELSIEEKLEQALMSDDEQPYEIPSNWVWTRVWSILSEIKNGTTTKQNKEFIGAKVTRIESIQNNKIDFNRVGYIAELESIKDSDWYIADDIAFSHINSAEHVGKTAIIYEDLLPLVHGMNLLRLRLNKACISKYFYYFSQSFQYKQSILERINMAVNQVSINQKQVGDIEFPIPPLAEQQRIVDRIESLFKKLENAKELAQNALDTFETRKAAILHKAFTGELTAQWREKNGVGMDSWVEKLLKDTDIEIIDGDRGTNYPKKEDFSTDGYCVFLNAKNVTKNGFVFEELQFISREKDQILRKGRLEKGDVILTTRGTIGNIAYFDDSVPYEHIRINSGMVIYRGGKEFYKPFLCKLYQSDYILNQISSIKTGSAQPQLPIKIMKELKLPIPSFQEQQEIVSILDRLMENEQKAKELCDVITKVDLMKKAILARAFRGELGTNDPSEESAIELLKECLK